MFASNAAFIQSRRRSGTPFPRRHPHRMPTNQPTNEKRRHTDTLPTSHRRSASDSLMYTSHAPLFFPFSHIETACVRRPNNISLTCCVVVCRYRRVQSPMCLSQCCKCVCVRWTLCNSCDAAILCFVTWTNRTEHCSIIVDLGIYRQHDREQWTDYRQRHRERTNSNSFPFDTHVNKGKTEKKKQFCIRFVARSVASSLAISHLAEHTDIQSSVNIDSERACLRFFLKIAFLVPPYNPIQALITHTLNQI